MSVIKALAGQPWRALMGTHPWINSPSRAQMLHMWNLRGDNGAFTHSLDDIMAATGYGRRSGNINVLASMASQARNRHGVDFAIRPSARPPERMRTLVEALARAGGDRAAVAEAYGTTPFNLSETLSRAKDDALVGPIARSLVKSRERGSTTLRAMVRRIIEDRGPNVSSHDIYAEISAQRAQLGASPVTLRSVQNLLPQIRGGRVRVARRGALGLLAPAPLLPMFDDDWSYA